MSRLFHSLVVCGAGLTVVSCGGRSTSSGAELEPADGAGSGGQAGGGGSGGGGVSSAGRPSLGQGGVIMLPNGGSAGSLPAGGGTPIDPSTIPPGAEGQWACDVELSACIGGRDERSDLSAYELTAPCRSEPGRPRRALDCAADELFSCTRGLIAGSVVFFNCTCLPRVGDECTCPPTSGPFCTYPRAPAACGEGQSLCGCVAMTCILK